MPEIRDPSSIEESRRFTPRFDTYGLIPCITVDASNGDVLMFAWMNAESLRKTLETGFVYYWSRSRQAIWKKGETSGSTQRVVEIRTDCDQDVLLVRAAVADRSGTCHTGRASCFYRSVPLGGGSMERQLTFAEDGEPPGEVAAG
jgi:phosphoribosyl-AMP cyclohydrolase